MTLIVGNVVDVGLDGLDGTLRVWAWFRPEEVGLIAPYRREWDVTGGVIADGVDVVPGPAVIEVDVGMDAYKTFEVIVPDQPEVTIQDLYSQAYPWEPYIVSQMAQYILDAQAAAEEARRASEDVGAAIDEAAGQVVLDVEQDRVRAEAARVGAEAARDVSEGHAAAAAASATTAGDHAGDAAGSVAAVEAAATAAGLSEEAAAGSAADADVSASQALGYRNAALGAAEAAEGHKEAAAGSASDAAGSATVAGDRASQAAASAEASGVSAGEAATAAAVASTQAGVAEGHAGTAASHASDAAGSATEAGDARDGAVAARTGVEDARDAAASSATSAGAARDGAVAARDTAAGHAGTAAGHANDAAVSAAAASGSAATASTKASEAATSATDAAAALAQVLIELANTQAYQDVLTAVGGMSADWQADIQAALADLVGQAPETLDTLAEVAAALGNDPNFATTVMDLLGQKVGNSDPRLSDARTPTAHTHSMSEVDGLGDALDGKSASGHTHTWDQIGQKPGTFPSTIALVAGLQAALDGKSASGHTHTKAQVGLGNVDNTSDANKPVSTAVQSALNAKSDVGHKHPVSDLTMTGTASSSTFARGDGTWATPPNTTYAVPTQAEAEAGTATTGRAFSAQRVRQAADAAIGANGRLAAAPATWRWNGTALPTAASQVHAQARVGDFIVAPNLTTDPGWHQITGV